MKKNSIKLLALLFAGCISINGCGAAAPAANTTDTAAPADASNAAQSSTAQTGTGNDQTVQTDNSGLTDAANDQTTAQTDNSDPTDAAGGAEAQAGDPAPASDLSPADVSNTYMDSSLKALANSYAKPESSSSEAEAPTGEKHSLVGIITDATKYSVAVQTPDGTYYYMTIPETGVTGNLDYITVGQMATLTYVGSLDENHASLVGISDSSMVTGIYLEEYAFAIKIINAVKSMDMKALSDLTNFPVFIDTGNYSGPMNTSGEFEAINNEKIFTEALVSRIVNYNLFDLKYTDAGFVMGVGTPSITFDVDDDGILGIIGINSAPAPAKDK